MSPRKNIIKEEQEAISVNAASKPAVVEKSKKTAIVKKLPARKTVKTEKTEKEDEAPKILKEPKPENEPVEIMQSPQTNRGALFLGGGLLLMGLLLLLGRFLSIPFSDFLWPFIFIIPGVLVFLSALVSDSSSGEGLSILGAILAALGLVFLVQEITGLWASWAYIWALIAPASVGAAQMAYGNRKGRDAIAASGKRLLNLGLTIFAIGFVFFELILGISGFGIGNLGLPVFPVMLVFLGVVILVRALTKNH